MKKVWKKYENNIMVFKNIINSHHSAVNLLKTVVSNNQTQEVVMMCIPQIELSALTCELLIKYIQIKERGQYLQVHRLETLFQYVSSEKKKAIRSFVLNKINSTGFDFDKTLKENSDLFVDARYCFEKGIKADVLFLDIFMEALAINLD